jgi:hypothetical protein
MYCTRCGAHVVAEAASFCASCGAPLLGSAITLDDARPTTPDPSEAAAVPNLAVSPDRPSTKPSATSSDLPSAQFPAVADPGLGSAVPPQALLMSPKPPPPTVPAQGERRSSRRAIATWVGLAAVIISGVIIAVISSTGRSSANDPGGGALPDPSGVSDAASVCKVEVNSALDVTENAGLTNGSPLMSAIGTVTPILQLSMNMIQPFEVAKQQFGLTTAEEQIVTHINQACAHAGNPMLTQEQVSALAQISSSGDAALLNQVTLFGAAPSPEN